MTTPIASRPVAGDGAEGPGGLASVLLSPVMHEASAAVLVVDLARKEIAFANGLARQFAPDRLLPARIRDWSTAAGFEDGTAGPAESACRSALLNSCRHWHWSF